MSLVDDLVRGDLMARLLVHVEGETEEAFVKEQLYPHLSECGYESVGARLMGNARLRAQRGGVRGWDQVKRDIVRHLSEDRNCLATTMVDYYGMPASGSKAWPGRADAVKKAFEHRASTVEAALQADICTDMGIPLDQSRFIPFVTIHEFEGLLFSDCAAFANSIGRESLKGQLEAVRNQFDTPEQINDSPQSAPSKRLQFIIPGYQKVLHGNVAALGIGLTKIRESCPHFDGWLSSLEARAN